MKVVVVGGGISGLTLALALHERGIQAEVFDSAPKFAPLGAGISLLPHGVRVLTGLGLLPELESRAVRFREAALFNEFGQLVYREPADEEHPQFLIHRAELHSILLEAVVARLGADAVVLGHRCTGVTQSATGATAHFVGTETGEPLPSRSGDVVIGSDGIHSAVRAELYPDEGDPVFSGVNMWRGLSPAPPFLSGGTHVRAGTLDTGKMVLYPVKDDIDGAGTQLINWVAEIRSSDNIPVDWSREGNLEQFYPAYEDWRFDWLDVAALIRRAETVLEWPMCDRDPVDQWAFGRIALIGDAAHPMLPRGSNGGMQAIIDSRVVADCLAEEPDPVAALRRYESARLTTVNEVVLTNRSTPPDHLIEIVQARTGGKPFEDLDAIISRDELKALFHNYKRVAGFDKAALTGPADQAP